LWSSQKEIKPLNNGDDNAGFGKNITTRDGFANECRACISERHKKDKERLNNKLAAITAMLQKGNLGSQLITLQSTVAHLKNLVNYHQHKAGGL
jgi:hypothetical protein